MEGIDSSTTVVSFLESSVFPEQHSILSDKLFSSDEYRDDEVERDRVTEEVKKWDGEGIFTGFFATAIGSAWIGMFLS